MIENSQINDSVTESAEFSFFDTLQIVVDHLRLLIVAPLLLGALVTGAVVFLVEHTYTSKVRFLAPQPPQSMGAGALNSLGIQGLAGGLGATLRNPSDIYLSFMKSNLLLDNIIDNFELKNDYKEKTKEEIRDAVGKKAEIVLSKDNIVSVEIKDKSPQRAADIANSYPVELKKIISNFGVQEASNRRQFLTKQVADLKLKVQSLELELKSMGVSIDALKLDIRSSISELASLKAAISAAEIRLRSMQSYLAVTAPEYKMAVAELTSLQVQLEKSQKAQPIPKEQDESQAKYRDYLYTLELVGLLTKQAELAQVDVNKNEVHLQILDVAEPAPRKSAPSYRNTLLLTVSISGFFLLVYVFVRHAFRNAAQDQEMKAKFQRLRKGFRRAFFGDRKVES